MATIVETRLPSVTLRRWLAKHPGVVARASYESGLLGGSGYDLLLRPGLACEGEHGIIEGSATRALMKLRLVEPCACQACAQAQGGRS